NISVPTIPAIARAREYLDETGNEDVTLIATGGLRTESDFVKAMALGADGVAVANAAMQAIGCLGMRACDSNNCPVGIATQKEGLRNRLVVDQAASGLENFFAATTKLMKVLARACGHERLDGFDRNDLTAWKRDVAELAGVEYAGAGRPAGGGRRATDGGRRRGKRTTSGSTHGNERVRDGTHGDERWDGRNERRSNEDTHDT
ncbi:MAG: glutamate synthase-related protein, partial [Halobaculum sp.]